MYEYTKIQGPRLKIFITENKLHAHHKDPFAYSQKVYNNQTSEFCELRFLCVHLFLSNQCFQATEFVDRHVSEKL